MYTTDSTVDRFAEDMQFYGYEKTGSGLWQNALGNSAVNIGTLKRDGTGTIHGVAIVDIGNIYGIMIFREEDIPLVARELSECLLFRWGDSEWNAEEDDVRSGENVLATLGFHSVEHNWHGVYEDSAKEVIKLMDDPVTTWSEEERAGAFLVLMSNWKITHGAREALICIRPDLSKIPYDRLLSNEELGNTPIYTLIPEDIALVKQMLLGAN